MPSFFVDEKKKVELLVAVRNSGSCEGKIIAIMLMKVIGVWCKARIKDNYKRKMETRPNGLAGQVELIGNSLKNGLWVG